MLEKLDVDFESIHLCLVTNSGYWAWSSVTVVETVALLVFSNSEEKYFHVLKYVIVHDKKQSRGFFFFDFFTTKLWIKSHLTVQLSLIELLVLKKTKNNWKVNSFLATPFYAFKCILRQVSWV